MAKMKRATTKEAYLWVERQLEETHVQRAKELRVARQVRWDGVVVWGPPGLNGDDMDCI
jgi:hypothetical protein